MNIYKAKYKICHTVVVSVLANYRVGLGLRYIQDAIEDENFISMRDVADLEPYTIPTKNKSVIEKWEAIRKFGASIEKIVLDFSSLSVKEIDFSRVDCKFVVDVCREGNQDFDGAEVQGQIHEWRDMLWAAAEEIPSGDEGKHKLRSNFFKLFNIDFVHPFINGLLKRAKIGEVKSENLFSAQPNRKDAGCQCTTDMFKRGGDRGCARCDPLHVLLFPNIVRLHMNTERHNSIFTDESVDCEKIFQHFEETRQHIPNTEILLRILAMVFHFAGMSGHKHIWEGDKKPNTLEKIWNEFPSEIPIRKQIKRVEQLLQNNHGWGKKENYVDQEERRSKLRDAIRMSPVVTIHGEGGLGKTELIYQNLHEMIREDGNDLKFDYLFPYTFKGKLQGEFDPESPSGRTEDANQIGWETTENASLLIALMARKNFEDTAGVDFTSQDLNISHAAEFLANNAVWLIIDNHEVVEDGNNLLDRFLDKFWEKIQSDGRRLTDCKSRIVITTRVKPSQNRVGQVYPVPPLNYQEMGILAKKRAIWLTQTARKEILDNRVNAISQLKTQNLDAWKTVEDSLRVSLNTPRMEKTAGHPYVVFIAVTNFLFDKSSKDKEFPEILQSLVTDFLDKRKGDKKRNTVTLLQEYMLANQMEKLHKKEELISQYHQLSTLLDFSEKVGKEIFQSNWALCRDDLLAREHIVLRNADDEDDGEYTWRNRFIADSLRSDLESKHGELKYDLSGWNWWKERMRITSPHSSLRPSSLRMIDIPTSTENSKNRLAKEKNLTLLKFTETDRKYQTQDAREVLNIISHFGKIYFHIADTGTYPLSKSNSAQNIKDDFVNFLYEIFEAGTDGLMSYLRTLKQGKEKTSSMELELVNELTYFFNSALARLEAVSNKSAQIEIRFDGNAINEKLKLLFIEMLQCLPNYDSTRAWVTYPLLMELCGRYDVQHEASYLWFSLAGRYSEETDNEILEKIRQLVQQHTEINWQGRKFSSTELHDFGTLLVDLESPLKDDEITIFLTKLTQHVEKEENQSDMVFKEVEVRIASNGLGSTILGTDQEDDSWKIFNCPSAFSGESDQKMASHEERLGAKLHHLSCIPLKQVLDSETGGKTTYALFTRQHSVESVVDRRIEQIAKSYSISKIELRPITDVSRTEMASLLRKIKFTGSIPAAALFGEKLKQILRDEQIDHTGKVWRKWRDHRFPNENITEIVENLLEGEWKTVYLDSGYTNATIFRSTHPIPQAPPICLNCGDNNDVEIKESEVEENLGTGDITEFVISAHCSYCEHDIDNQGACLEIQNCPACEKIPRCPDCTSRFTVSERGDLPAIVSMNWRCEACDIVFDDFGNTATLSDLPSCNTCGDNNDVAEEDGTLRCEFCHHDIDEDGDCTSETWCFGCTTHQTICLTCNDDGDIERDFDARTLLCTYCNHYLDAKHGFCLDSACERCNG
jgi:hypothetical protein